MKLFRLILISLIISLSGNLISQDGSVNIIASGFGQNESEAINNALRNCIERAYGVFITSASSIVNDSLVKDEIYQIGKGAINKYEIINKNENGTEVTVSAYVSPEGVVSYVNSKSSTELKVKGNLFSRNVDKEKFYLDQEYLVVKEFIESKKNLTFFEIDTIIIFDPRPINKESAYDAVEALPKKWQYRLIKSYNTKEWLRSFDYALNTELIIKPNQNYFTYYNELLELLNSLKLEQNSARNLFKYTSGNALGSKGWTFEIEPNAGFDDYKFSYQKKCPEEPIEPSQLIYNATSYIEPTKEYVDSLIVASFISKKGFKQWWNGGWGFKTDWEKQLHDKLIPKLLKAQEKKLPISKYPKEYLSRYHTQRNVSGVKSILKENWEKVENEKKDSIREINDKQTMLYLSRLEEYNNCVYRNPSSAAFLRNQKSLTLLKAFDLYLASLQTPENIEIDLGPIYPQKLILTELDGWMPIENEGLNYRFDEIFSATVLRLRYEFRSMISYSFLNKYCSFDINSRINYILPRCYKNGSRFKDSVIYEDLIFGDSKDRLNSFNEKYKTRDNYITRAYYTGLNGESYSFKDFFDISDEDGIWNGISGYVYLRDRKAKKYLVSMLISADELNKIEDVNITYSKQLPPFCLCKKWSQMTCADESIMEKR